MKRRISFAHLINPVRVDCPGDLRVAQPVTFASIEAAQKFATDSVGVELYAVQFFGEKRAGIPECFTRLPDLERSVVDIKDFRRNRRLPLIRDLLDRLWEASDADYFIYTNVDIAVQPHFYLTVRYILEQGYDAFVINRRTISKHYNRVRQLPLMYAEAGEKHKGWDCFVFRRALYPDFFLGEACIGTGWIGRVMIINMACLARRFRVFEDLHATFHIGNDKIWKDDMFSDYLMHNMREGMKVLLHFDSRGEPLDRKKIPGRFFRLLEKAGMMNERE